MKAHSSMRLTLVAGALASLALTGVAQDVPPPLPETEFCEDPTGQIVPCNSGATFTFTDACVNEWNEPICADDGSLGTLAEGVRLLPPQPYPSPSPTPYPSPQPSPDPSPYPSPYPSPSPLPPPPPQPQPQWYCTLDSRPQWTSEWFYWGQQGWRVTGPFGGATFISVALGDQLAGLSCAINGNQCEIRNFGFSSASTCFAALGWNCQCDNDIAVGTTQPQGKTIAETKCSYKSNISGAAQARVQVQGQGVNVNLNWTVAGGVFGNGGRYLDSCSWKQLAVPPRAAPAPPRQAGTPALPD